MGQDSRFMVTKILIRIKEGIKEKLDAIDPNDRCIRGFIIGMEETHKAMVSRIVPEVWVQI